MGEKILVIEDELHIAEGIKLNLMLQGYEVVVAPNGREGVNKWKTQKYDLIILDLMLPELDGLSVMKEIRRFDERIPILVVSAKDQDIDKIRALEGGVDDYLTKPFNLDEFLLRVLALLKRAKWALHAHNDESQIFTFGNNQVDLVKQQARTESGLIKLTLQEVKLIELFAKNIGRPLSREEILELGWGVDGTLTTRTVDNFIVRFRKYFEKDPKNPIYFKSVRSVGYIFEVS